MNDIVTVVAVPLQGDKVVLLECSVCGPLQVCPTDQVAIEVGRHLQAHGCDMDEILITKTEDR